MAVTFAYKCTTCGAEQDARSDEPIPSCPAQTESSIEPHRMRKVFMIAGAMIKW